MKYFLGIFSFLLFAIGCSTKQVSREIILLDEGWKFINQDVPEAEKPGTNTKSWQTICVPYDWAMSHAKFMYMTDF